MLIADSGSTKTDWRLIDRDGNIHQCRTVGLNPYFTSDEAFIEAINEGPASLFAAEAIAELHFYGSGISNPEQNKRVKTILGELFPNARLFIEHDLLAAARAACGRKPGIALILGTGANSCTYDGVAITHNVMSLGFILGDEGSGADLGKRWMSAYLNQRVPQELAEAFHQAYGVTPEQVIKRVYTGDRPNRFLGSFAPFLSKHLNHPYVVRLVSEAFNELFERYLLRYEDHRTIPINCCGSVAFHFAKVLRAVAETHGMRIGTVIAEPVAALTLYHLSES